MFDIELVTAILIKYQRRLTGKDYQYLYKQDHSHITANFKVNRRVIVWSLRLSKARRVCNVLVNKTVRLERIDFLCCLCNLPKTARIHTMVYQNR